MGWQFSKPKGSEDFSSFLGETANTRKQLLIAECQKHSITIFIDDASEGASGIYTKMRAVASEAELERRLLARKAISKSDRANVIAIFSLIVAIATFAKSIWWP